MTFEQTLTYLVVGLTASTLGTYGVGHWLRLGKPATANPAQPAKDDTKAGARLRPTWSIRLGVPVVVLLILANLNIGAILSMIGITNTSVHQAVTALIWLAFGYGWVMTLCRQRVIWDHTRVISHGLGPLSQERTLEDLVDVRPHGRLPSLVLVFAGQRPLTVPDFLAQKDRFVAAMQEIVDRNTNNSFVPPMTGGRGPAAS